MKKRSVLWGILLIVLSMLAFVACGSDKKKLRINVPAEVRKAELGSYDLPKYEVVDENGLIMAGYTVEVESAVDPDGESVTVAYNKINAVKTGIYAITYTAGAEIEKAVLRVDFADRTAPKVDMAENALPAYYIVGFTYDLPTYSIIDEPDLSKCWIKVFYKASADAEQIEIAVENSRFQVEHNSGRYIVVIHAEDAAGNGKDYEYEVDAVGPSEIVEGKVLYFDEAFGVSQVKTLWNNFEISYGTEKTYGEEAGSTKVTSPQESGDYIILDRIIQSDVSDYTHLVVRIYNDNDFEAYSGYCWFGDVTLAPHAWTELKIPVSDLDTKNVSHPAVAGIVINSENIANLSLRLFSDYNTNKVPAGSTFYFSAMYAVVEAPTEPETVVENKIAYFDEAFGLEQVALYWSAPHKLSLDTEIKYGEEKGSLKVEVVTAQDNYIVLSLPWIKDVSAYDYLVFRVYNPTDKTFSMGTTWAADTVIAANAWTEVRIPVALFGEGKITNMDGTVLSATDVAGLPLRIFGAETLEIGDCFYISAVYGENN